MRNNGGIDELIGENEQSNRLRLTAAREKERDDSEGEERRGRSDRASFAAMAIATAVKMSARV